MVSLFCSWCAISRVFQINTGDTVAQSIKLPAFRPEGGEWQPGNHQNKIKVMVCKRVKDQKGNMFN